MTIVASPLRCGDESRVMNMVDKITHDWSTPMLIMSDLHLGRGESDSPILKALLKAAGLEGDGVSVERSMINLEQTRSTQPVKRIVLLGDLFDFNLAYRDTVFRAHLPLFFCLERIRRAGVEVVISTGNHDPDPSPVFAEDLGCVVITKPTTALIYGDRVLLEHGDLLEPSSLKRLLCRAVRHPLTRSLARALPPALTWRLTQYVTHPQEFDPAYQVPLEPLISRRWDDLYAQGFQYWLFGHFHQALAWAPPEDPTVNPRVFVLGEQHRLQTCLYWDDLGPSLSRWNGGISDDSLSLYSYSAPQ